MQHVSGLSSTTFLLYIDNVVSEKAEDEVKRILFELASDTPLQYALGEWDFCNITLACDARALIPRPETELLAHAAIAQISRCEKPIVVDLGTGTGALALVLASVRSDAKVIATDLSSDALSLAKENACRNVLDERIAFVEGFWFEALPIDLRGMIDCVVSNPPYVARGDKRVEHDVIAHEPHSALYSGADGLDDIRVIIGQAPEWLRPGGVLLVEHGDTQGAAVRGLANNNGFVDVHTERDLASRDRFLCCRMPPSR